MSKLEGRRLVYAKPLLLTRLVPLRRRSGFDVSLSKPSRPSCETPRFFEVGFDAQAHGSRGVRLSSVAPTAQIKTSKNEGLGLSKPAQARRPSKGGPRDAPWNSIEVFGAAFGFLGRYLAPLGGPWACIG